MTSKPSKKPASGEIIAERVKEKVAQMMKRKPRRRSWFFRGIGIKLNQRRK